MVRLVLPPQPSTSSAPKHPYPPGTRVRHWGDRWVGVNNKGSATVEKVLPLPDGTYEYYVKRDKPLCESMSPLTWWGQHHVVWVSSPPER